MLVLVCLAGSCASAPGQSPLPAEHRLELAPGGGEHIPGSDLRVVFVAVTEDSRCPVGVNCVWAGDAAVAIRIESRGADSSTYTLHTNEQFAREVSHGDWRIRLDSLVPQPTADGPPRREDYRLTLVIHRAR